MKILIACEQIVLRGGLLRFERFARAILPLGYKVSYCLLSKTPQFAWRSDFPILTIELAILETWQVTMIPGAGFNAEIFDQFKQFNAPRFGLRVQHILNDASKLEGFDKINQAFQPNLVVLNNRHWRSVELAELQYGKIEIVEGGVELSRFASVNSSSNVARHHGIESKVILGGLANKNPIPLIESIRKLPNRFILRLFGVVAFDVTDYENLVCAGRLQLKGVLDEDGLVSFYRDVDMVVHTELYAGWSNLVAEAMASSVPVICTKHGTLSLSEHLVTAIVLQKAHAVDIASAALMLDSHPEQQRHLSLNAYQRVSRFDWLIYSKKMIKLLQEYSLQ